MNNSPYALHFEGRFAVGFISWAVPTLLVFQCLA